HRTARLLSGALGLLMSGRSSPAGQPSPLRSKPFWTVNGVPDWKVVMPAIDQPPATCFQKGREGPGISHKYERTSRWPRSKSLGPRSSLRPPCAAGTEVKLLLVYCVSIWPIPSLVLSRLFDHV